VLSASPGATEEPPGLSWDVSSGPELRPELAGELGPELGPKLTGDLH